MPRTTPTPRPAGPTRLRWLAAPAVAALVVGAFAVAPSVAGTDSPPTLAPISARDLVAKVSHASVPGFSGTITSQPHLGLPDLGAVTGDNSGFFTSLLTGSHTLNVWQAGSDVRLSLPTTLAEQDVVRHGSDVWVWQSDGHQATHLALSPDKGTGTGQHDAVPAGVTPTPQSLADHFLSSADPTTRVFVRDTVTVAGRPAYELVLAPRSGTTLVADVVIAVDSDSGLPLRVQVLSRDSGTPAIDVGFTAFDPSVPAASTFAFTPPPGATVTEAQSAADLLLPGGHGTKQPATGQSPAPPASEPKPQVVGTGWDSIAVIDLGSGTGGNARLGSLAKLGTPVQGSWGSGRLLSTSLVNVLLTDHNTLLVGSVPESALEAAAAGH